MATKRFRMATAQEEELHQATAVAQEEEINYLHDNTEGRLTRIVQMEQQREYLVALQEQELTIRLLATKHARLTRNAALCAIQLSQAKVVKELMIKEFNDK